VKLSGSAPSFRHNDPTGSEARELGMAGFRFDDSEEEFWSPEPIVGWRGWRWFGSGLRGMRAWWHTDVLIAECGFCSAAPSLNHTCGIYALKPGHSATQVPGGHLAVVGMVELSGLVIEHERGYRAEVARITELWAPSYLVEPIQITYPSIPVHPANWDDQRSMIWAT
jgi:hypothetical protein